MNVDDTDSTEAHATGCGSLREPQHPWDRQPDEPTEAYVRFLLYRNIGPARTLAAAYGAYLASASDGAAEGRKGYASGVWTENSARWRWLDRAAAWDIHMLSSHGERLALVWIGILTTMAERCAERLADPDFTPKNFAEIVAVIGQLSAYVTPEVLRALAPKPKPVGGESLTQPPIEDPVKRRADVK